MIKCVPTQPGEAHFRLQNNNTPNYKAGYLGEDIILYHVDTGTDKRVIRSRMEGDMLTLDGYDRGVPTKQLTGDFDYEYQIMVASSALPPLYIRFGLQVGQWKKWLEAIAIEITGENAYTLLREMLPDAGVTFDTWSA